MTFIYLLNILIIRDASYTTQPVELLNSLGFENTKKHLGLPMDSEVNISESQTPRPMDNGKLDGLRSVSGEDEKVVGQASSGIGGDSPGKYPSASILHHHAQETDLPINLEESEGLWL